MLCITELIGTRETYPARTMFPSVESLLIVETRMGMAGQELVQCATQTFGGNYVVTGSDISHSLQRLKVRKEDGSDAEFALKPRGHRMQFTLSQFMGQLEAAQYTLHGKALCVVTAPPIPRANRQQGFDYIREWVGSNMGPSTAVCIQKEPHNIYSIEEITANAQISKTDESTCPFCGSAGAYIGFSAVECNNPSCERYVR